CECGNKKIISAKNLKNGSANSCGCLRSELIKKRFLDSNVKKQILSRRARTNIDKYGVSAAVQNPEIALKIARSSNNSYILNHWKDGREIVCRGSCEYKTVLKFNVNHLLCLF
ncbi:MAG: hypothetical protein AABY22_12345, partial [Nanoarchaeota archaeon]